MIKKTSAYQVFELNMERTNMLIQAVEKIHAYNYLYQEKAYDTSPEYRNIVKISQDSELEKISTSCHEHALISIATTLETFLNELVQELLYKFKDYFLNQKTIWKDKINEILNDSEDYDLEQILVRLNLNNRFQVLAFFKIHNIIIFTSVQEIFIKTIYIKRNNFVHNGSKLSKKASAQIKELNIIAKNEYSDLSIKTTRTKFKRMMINCYKNIIQSLEMERKGKKY